MVCPLVRPLRSLIAWFQLLNDLYQASCARRGLCHFLLPTRGQMTWRVPLFPKPAVSLLPRRPDLARFFVTSLLLPTVLASFASSLALDRTGCSRAAPSIGALVGSRAAVVATAFVEANTNRFPLVMCFEERPCLYGMFALPCL